MLFDNRTETQNISNTDFIILNTGSSRHRGLEGELSYDFLARFQHPPLPELQAEPGKGAVDASKAIPVPGVSPKDYHPLKLIAFSNVQFLDAEFTESTLLIPDTNKTIVGNTPAFAPNFLMKGGLQLRRIIVSTSRSRLSMSHNNSGRTRTLGTPRSRKHKLHLTGCLILQGISILPEICGSLPASPISQTKNTTIACSPTASNPHRVAPVTPVYPWHFDRLRRW
jgi:hypothetical protein